MSAAWVVVIALLLGAALNVLAGWVLKPDWLPHGVVWVLLLVCVAGAVVAGLVGLSQQRDNEAETSDSPIAGMTGGCATYQVFAQNRWAPYGTAIRQQPSVLSTQIGSFPGNMSVAVNGWVHGRAAYPTNTPPYNSDIWFHLADGAGWISFGGVRATVTSNDPTGLADGGPPAAAPSKCEAGVR